MSSVAPGSMRAWVMAMRPATLLVGVVPVLVGAAVARAHGPVRPWAIVAALLGALLIQIGTNFANDLCDHEKGADTPERLGPVRATQAGLLSPKEIRAGTIAAFMLATVVGAYLASVAGYEIIVVGVLSIAAGLSYTGGPWPTGYHGLGDLFVFVFFGLVAVCGTSFVATGSIPAAAWVAAIPVGGLSTAVLVVNNVRDRNTDEVAGKRTLVVRFGRTFGVVEYASLVLISYLVPIAFVALGWQSSWGLFPLATFPFALWLVRRVHTEEGASLNQCLAGTARLLFAFGVLFATTLCLKR